MTELFGSHLSSKVGFTLYVKAMKRFICWWIFSLLFGSFPLEGDRKWEVSPDTCLWLSCRGNQPACWSTARAHLSAKTRLHPSTWMTSCLSALRMHVCPWAPGVVFVFRDEEGCGRRGTCRKIKAGSRGEPHKTTSPHAIEHGELYSKPCGHLNGKKSKREGMYTHTHVYMWLIHLCW